MLHVWSWDRGLECYSCCKCDLEVKRRNSKYWDTKCEGSIEINLKNEPSP